MSAHSYLPCLYSQLDHSWEVVLCYLHTWLRRWHSYGSNCVRCQRRKTRRRFSHWLSMAQLQCQCHSTSQPSCTGWRLPCLQWSSIDYHLAHRELACLQDTLCWQVTRVAQFHSWLTRIRSSERLCYPQYRRTHTGYLWRQSCCGLSVFWPSRDYSATSWCSSQRNTHEITRSVLLGHLF